MNRRIKPRSGIASAKIGVTALPCARNQWAHALGPNRGLQEN